MILIFEEVLFVIWIYFPASAQKKKKKIIW